jgi:YD repeat-containing protein
MRIDLVTLAVLAVGMALPVIAQSVIAPWQTDARAKAGLHGPVKTCSEEIIQTYPGGSSSLVQNTEYSADGRVVSFRSRGQGSSDSLTTYEYDSSGRLLRSTSGRADAAAADRSVTNYEYDQTGTLIAITALGGHTVKFGRDDQGRRIKIVPVPELPTGSAAAVAADVWEGGELPLGAPPKGSIVTVFDEQGLPIEGQARDAEGRVVSRIIRSYDGKGRATGDRLIPVDTSNAVPAELAAQLNPEQMKAVGAFIGSQFSKGQTALKYGSDERLLEKRLSLPALGDEITAISYNDHGDISLERTAQQMPANAGVEYGLTEDGKMVPTTKPDVHPPTVTESRYEYAYDSHGNWTSQKVYVSGDTVPHREHTRTLTYF